jgi:hypothetical protein
LKVVRKAVEQDVVKSFWIPEVSKQGPNEQDQKPSCDSAPLSRDENLPGTSGAADLRGVVREQYRGVVAWKNRPGFWADEEAV